MDWANWSTARKILLPASLLLLLDSFLNWQQVDLGIAEAGQSMWHGLGFLVGILLIALIVWELLAAFSPDTTRSLPGGLITLALAAAILLFTLIYVLTLDFRHWPAWVGLILSAVIAYGGWLRFQESDDRLPNRATSSTAGSGTSAGGSSGTSSGDDMPASTPPASSGGMGGSGTSGAGSSGMGGTTGSGGTGTGGMGSSSTSDREGTPPA